jgi:formate C-acetyltransferase
MNQRTSQLRQASLETPPAISSERARLITEFYQANEGRHSIPMMRALSFHHLCRHKTLHIGPGELIVGERGPRPKSVPTYPELTCHSLEDLRILNSRPKTHYAVDEACLQTYQEKVVPYWSGRSMRDKIFNEMSDEWKAAYDAGIFTEFMEQRAPGHTVLDDKIYHTGMLDFKKQIQKAMDSLDYLRDPRAYARREQLRAMAVSCDAVILFAERHAELALEMAAQEPDVQRQAELRRIAEVCRHVPAHAPRDFQEALQYYWFCHLAVITELNGWDSFNPGHLDQHLQPFYQSGIDAGTLTAEQARELLECFFIKFNNHPAPPKVGVTAAESGTYTDFANINVGGLLKDGSNAVNDVSYLLLEIIDEMHLLQPSSNIQLSRKNPDAFLKATLRVLRKGYGFPSIFNADTVVQEQLRQGKTLEDARGGGCSGCVEVGAFGKEAYILTGYFNLVKVLEVTLHNGKDPRTGKQIGLQTGTVEDLVTYEQLFDAYIRQLHHFFQIKLQGNQIIESLFATLMPAPFLSVLIDDCIVKGLDYNAGGARYNNTFIQMVGLGTIADCLAALRETVYETRVMSLAHMKGLLDSNFANQETWRQRLVNRTHKYGNDDDYADDLMREVFDFCVREIDGQPNTKGGHYRVEMLPTTCHVYFGSVTGATPDGRLSGYPLSEGISPVQGVDRNGPTAVIKSASKMDHIKTGGTLLNMKFTPGLVSNEDGIDKWAQLVRGYFRMDGHHVQFNVIGAETLRQAQLAPEQHRDLIVRVAGYSDYFCDLSRELQEEIITRTEHASF